MGCASSNPLAQSGKNLIESAKDSATEITDKGEHILEDVKDSTKEGVEHVKESMESAFESVESSVSTAVGKIGETFAKTESHLHEAEDKANENVAEAVSEAETILASESEEVTKMATEAVDEMKDEAHEATEAVFQKVESVKEDLPPEVDDSLKLEDMEQSLDTVDSDFSDLERHVDDDSSKRLPTPAPIKMEVKEETPTHWEAAHDAILEKRVQSIEIEVTDYDNELEEDPTSKKNTLNSEKILPEDHLGEIHHENHETKSDNSFILNDE